MKISGAMARSLMCSLLMSLVLFEVCQATFAPPTTTTKRREQCFCPAIFDPVCCMLNGVKKTSGNSCECSCQGGSVVSDGECPDPLTCACPKILAPVCCKRTSDGSTFTAGNECLCKCEGEVVSKGRCQTKPCTLLCAQGRKCAVTPSGPRCVPEESCKCAAVGGAVCCTKNYKTEWYATKCDCNCRGGQVVDNEKCEEKPDECVCPTLFDPVCCRTKSGLVVAGNKCECRCKKGSVVDDNKCPDLPGGCQCDAPKSPVCCQRRSDSKIFKAENKCYCQCLGKVLSESKCSDVLGCNTVKCAGGNKCIDTSSGPKCVPDPCICTKEFNPVCCKRYLTEETYQAGNPCECKCDGEILDSNQCQSKPTCASTLCLTGTRCEETPEGARCVPAVTCANVRCAGKCIDTPEGPKCQPVLQD